MQEQNSNIIWVLLLILFSFTEKATAQTALISKERERLLSIKDSIELINSMSHVGMLYQAKNVDSCLYYGLKAKALSAKLHYAKGEADASNVIGVALQLRGLFKESLEMYSGVLTRYRQLADTENVVQVLMNMALVYGEMRDSINCKRYFHRAINMGRSLKRDSILSMLYVNYCMNTPSLSEDSINYYLNKSVKIAQRYKSEWVPVLVMQVQAGILISNHRKGVLPILEKTLHKARELKMELLEMSTFVLFGDYYINNVDTALKYYHRAYDLMISSGYKNMLIPAASTILQTTKLSGNAAAIERAHELMEEALTKESEGLKNFIGDYVKYNAIKEDNKLLSVSNSSKQSKIWMLIVLCSLCGLLAFFMYRQYRTFRRLHKTVSEQNSHLQKALTALEQSQADNTRMMKIVAHDLRNPIGGIYSIASLMLEDEDINYDRRMMLEMIKTSGQNSLDLVSDLLQVHTKTEGLKKEPVDLRQLLLYCVKLLKPKAEDKGQSIKLFASSATLAVSREKMWRVVSNLIANAIKFSPTGAVIMVRLIKEPGNIRMEVADRGIGIPADMKEKIFDMFTETKRKGTAGEQPFGMGLAISKQIVEAHGGSIWYESSPGEGTTFFVKLSE